MTARPMRRWAAWVALAWVALAGAVHCASAPDKDEKIRLRADLRPDVASYVHVHPYLENRCGSLDCHGSEPRAFRIYGRRGLREIVEAGARRDDAGAVSNGRVNRDDPTTLDERLRTYESLVGLEPEETRRVVTGETDPSALLVVRKAMERERHKGGHVLVANETSFVCLTTWLKLPTGTPLPEAVVSDCKLAAAQDVP